MGQFKGAIGGFTGQPGKDNGEKKQSLVSTVRVREGCRLFNRHSILPTVEIY